MVLFVRLRRMCQKDSQCFDLINSQRWGRKSTEKVGKDLDSLHQQLLKFLFWLRNIWCSDLLFLLFLNRVWDAVGSWAVSRSTFGGRLEDNIPPQNHGSFSEHSHSPHSKGNEWSGHPITWKISHCEKFSPEKAFEDCSVATNLEASVSQNYSKLFSKTYTK